jgi:hypothetical protein
MELSDLEKRILAYCSEDDMGLWVVVSDVYGDAYLVNATLPTWVREKTVELVNKLLSKGLIVIGRMARIENNVEFIPITGSDDEIIRAIEQEWDDVGRAPIMGDLFWIQASRAGEQLAKDLGLET